jgi:TorA maturation chaperone TorD
MMSSAPSSAVQLSPSVAKHLLSEEDQARANWYAWFAANWLAAPTQTNIDLWAAQLEGDINPATELEVCWLDVVSAAKRLGSAKIQLEFDALFSAVGKPEVFSFASYHLTGFLHERPLVEIRQRLIELDLGRFDVAITEDHLGLLCTSMKQLIAVNSDQQAAFFRDFLASWVEPFLLGIDVSPRSDFYRKVALLWQCFVAIEQQAFDFE